MSESKKGTKLSEETKEKLSLCFKGRERSEEWCNNISKGKKGKLTGESNPMYGKHHTEETRKDISKNRIENGIAKGKNNPRATQIICIENEIIFDKTGTIVPIKSTKQPISNK